MKLEEWTRGVRYDTNVSEATPDRLSIVLDSVGPDQRVLEVGCHTGYFSRLLRAQGCHVVGVEVNPDAAAVAQGIANDVVVGSIEDANVWSRLPRDVDVVLYMDVLEHLYDPWLTLRRTREHIERSARVLASLPNVACWSIRRELLKGRFVPPETGLYDPTHLRFFTLPDILELFSGTGFAPDRVVPLWTSIPFEHRLAKWPGVARRWRDWWVKHFPNAAIAVPLVEARPQ